MKQPAHLHKEGHTPHSFKSCGMQTSRQYLDSKHDLSWYTESTHSENQRQERSAFAFPS